MSGARRAEWAGALSAMGKRASGARNRATWPGPAGEPASTRGPLTRKENRYGSASVLPSIAVTPGRTVTVIVRAACNGAAGRNRPVTGSRHSNVPGTCGPSSSTASGSTARSSEPATGRSNVTATTAPGSAEPSRGAPVTFQGGGAAGAMAGAGHRPVERHVDEGAGICRAFRRGADDLQGRRRVGGDRGGRDEQRQAEAEHGFRLRAVPESITPGRPGQRGEGACTIIGPAYACPRVSRSRPARKSPGRTPSLGWSPPRRSAGMRSHLLVTALLGVGTAQLDAQERGAFEIGGFGKYTDYSKSFEPAGKSANGYGGGGGFGYFFTRHSAPEAGGPRPPA